MIVVTTDQIENKNINRVVGIIEATGSENVTLEPTNDGEISRGIKIASQNALNKLSEEASKVEADAVITVRLQVLETPQILEVLSADAHPETRVISGGNIKVITRGIAVLIENDNEVNNPSTIESETIVCGISSVLYESSNERGKTYDTARTELQEISKGTTVADVQEATCNLDILLKLPSGRIQTRKVFSVLLYGTATYEKRK